jgi:hypothetical protein
MPWALVTLLAMPFGFDRFTLVPVGSGIHAVIRVSEAVSSLPGAVVPVAAMPDWGLIAVTVGGLRLRLWRRSRSDFAASGSRRNQISWSTNRHEGSLCGAQM